jgi:hypothetical protein
MRSASGPLCRVALRRPVHGKIRADLRKRNAQPVVRIGLDQPGLQEHLAVRVDTFRIPTQGACQGTHLQGTNGLKPRDQFPAIGCQHTKQCARRLEDKDLTLIVPVMPAVLCSAPSLGSSRLPRPREGFASTDLVRPHGRTMVQTAACAWRDL